MSYLKFQASQLFNGYKLLDAHQVLITDEHGKIINIVHETEAGSDIQRFNGILSPGFINAHCHLELSHMKGVIPEKTGLIDFVFNVVTQRNKFSEDDILQAIANAEDEMINNGIVAVGDICNNTSTLAQKQKQRLHYYNFIEVSGWLPQIAELRFARSKEYYDAFSQLPASGSRLSLAPHAPYSVSEELWNLIKPSFINKTTTIHNQETKFEDDLFINATGDFIRMYQMMGIDNSFFKPSGKSSIQTYFHHLENAKNILFVHNTFIQKDDFQGIKFQLKQNFQQLFYCLCVNANNFIEDTLPPVELLKEQQSTIVIGTDSLASNRSLSILDELKTLQQSFPLLATQELLQWATINGSVALQMQDKLGSFEKNKQPGIILIEQMVNGKIGKETTVKKLL